MNICVYCSSSEAVDSVYFEAAEDLGKSLGLSGHSLVYGGARVGLMGALARAAKNHGCNVVGVMPRAINDHGINFSDADELIVTETLRERKRVMEERSDAFVALPGGFGTLEELLEILTLKQLHFHHKPVALMNTMGFYDPLLEVFEGMYERYFAKPEVRDLYAVFDSSAELLSYLENYKPPEHGDKWFETEHDH